MHKRSFTTALLLLILPFTINSQIVIDDSDMVQQGDTLYVANGAGIVENLDSETGENFNWDFSELTELTVDEQVYVSVESTPILYQFLFNNPFDPEHNSDFALSIEGFGVEGFEFEDAYAYYQNGGDDFRITGLGVTFNGIPFPAQNDPVDIIYDFPLEYQNTGSNYSEWPVEIPTILFYELSQQRNYEVDGYGMVTTPYDTYECLRVRMQIDAVDSLYINATEFGFSFERNMVEYHWLAADSGIPVLQINTMNDLVTSIRYLTGETEEEPISVLENEKGLIHFFPNPASESVTIQNSGAGMRALQILDSSGRIIENILLNESNTEFNVSHLKAGIYFLQSEGDPQSKRKLLIE